MIGIVAAKFVDLYNKPSFILTNSNNFVKCSCRSVVNFDVGNILNNALDQNIIINNTTAQNRLFNFLEFSYFFMFASILLWATHFNLVYELFCIVILTNRIGAPWGLKSNECFLPTAS